VTETHRWLAARRRELLLRYAIGGVLGTAGLTAAVCSAGIVLARLGLYRHVPTTVLLVWSVVVALLALGSALLWRRTRTLNVSSLARSVERSAHTRAGWIAGAASWHGAGTSDALAALADRQVSAWLTAEGSRAVIPPRRRARRSVATGAMACAAGFALLALSGPASGAGREFWAPFGTMARARGAVLLSVDRSQVQRGDTVRLHLLAPGRAVATLLVRAPGEQWRQRRLELDGAGAVSVLLGPLDSDRFVRAVSGGRESETVHVEVALPVLLTAVELTARFPAYLDRLDEFLPADGDSLWLPRGTRVRVRGRTTVPLAAAAWVHAADTVWLDALNEEFFGELPVVRDGRWQLIVEARGGGGPMSDTLVVPIVAVPDSVPTVAIPVPGTDTVAPITLRQGLVVDARDDHRIRRVELVSWRVTRRGERREPVVHELPVPEDGAQRVLLSWVMDLNDRGFGPGDTAFYRVRAVDNAPAANAGQSPVYSLRLPAVSELRRAMREASRSVEAGADSITEAQRELARRIEDLAAERERSAETAGAGQQRAEQMPFSAVERAREVLEDEERLTDRAAQLDEELRELAEAAWKAGLTDPAFHQQLQEIRALLDKAITEELQESLRALRDALDRLDSADVREALRQLADAADQLRDELDRGRELFQRAAVEGELTTLASDADELSERQRDWNEAVATADSAAAAEEERELAGAAEALAQALADLAESVDSLGERPEPLEEAGAHAGEAGGAMRQAAEQAGQSQRAEARQSGERASASLDPLGETLRQQRNQMRDAWRQEVMAELDRALVEAAELARRQGALAGRMRQGESGPEVRGAQAAVREGVERVARRLQTAAGKNALVSPRLATSLGLAGHRMDESLELLQRAVPIPSEAAESAGEAVDALNSAVFAMVQSRGDVSSAQSGSGLSEALERLAQLAEQQGALSGQSGGLLPLMEAGGAELLRQLQALAAEQRAMAQALERLQAGGEVSGAGEMAREAEELAGELEGGRLDQEILDRQERLFRRLLDAGRSLESEEDDQRRERVSETAQLGNVRLPTSDDVPVGAPRFRYPSWEELRSLSPEQRRLVLEYFRRLNRAPR
jgi:hypothetical protein